MALDHYVPQVHLRQFCVPETGRLFAMRKSDGHTFEPGTRNVCAIHDGNTNAYLREDRQIEAFLKEIEPRYTTAVSNLEAQQIDGDTIFTIAGFVSAVYSCSPTAMRLHEPQLKKLLNTTAELMDEHGKFSAVDELPHALGGKSMTDLLRSGKLQFKIDPKYPQAVSIAGVVDLARVFGNSKWDILCNNVPDSPYLTSDFPIAIEHVGQVNARIIPLTPKLAIRIIPNYDARHEKEKYDLTFGGFQWRKKELGKRDVRYINEKIVRCAEDLVFCSEKLDWFERFVKRHSAYEITTVMNDIPSPDGKGTLLIARQRVTQRQL